MNTLDQTPDHTVEALLEEAKTNIGNRAAERDKPKERSMNATVKAFNSLTGAELTEKDGWLFMVCLKLARATGGTKEKADDYIDAASYAALTGECALAND